MRTPGAAAVEGEGVKMEGGVAPPAGVADESEEKPSPR